MTAREGIRRISRHPDTFYRAACGLQRVNVGVLFSEWAVGCEFRQFDSRIELPRRRYARPKRIPARPRYQRQSERSRAFEQERTPLEPLRQPARGRRKVHRIRPARNTPHWIGTPLDQKIAHTIQPWPEATSFKSRWRKCVQSQRMGGSFSPPKASLRYRPANTLS